MLFEHGEKCDEVQKRRRTAKKVISFFVMRNPSQCSADIIAHRLVTGKVPGVYRLRERYLGFTVYFCSIDAYLYTWFITNEKKPVFNNQGATVIHAESHINQHLNSST